MICLRGVLDLADHADSGCPALGEDGLQGCVGAFAQGGVGLVGDQVGQLIHDQQHERLT